MKVLVTGNPNYKGLANGIQDALHDPLMYEVEFIGRHNGWNMLDYDTIASYASKFDVFVNSLYIPNQGQTVLLDKVWHSMEQGHIINISSTSVYWNNGKELYLSDKLSLEEYSKKLSNNCSWSNSNIKVSCVSFGPLDSQSKSNDTQNKISLLDAGEVIKYLIEQPTTMNTHYIVVDPIQTN